MAEKLIKRDREEVEKTVTELTKRLHDAQRQKRSQNRPEPERLRGYTEAKSSQNPLHTVYCAFFTRRDESVP